MKIKNSVNEYGTPVSIFQCEFCGRIFEVCPAVPLEKENEWTGCLSEKCSSYDASRDADKLFNEGKIIFYPKDWLN